MNEQKDDRERKRDLSVCELVIVEYIVVDANKKEF